MRITCQNGHTFRESDAMANFTRKRLECPVCYVPLEQQTIPEMTGRRLPKGKTCGDCLNFAMCNFILARHPKQKVCHWTPVRYEPSDVK